MAKDDYDDSTNELARHDPRFGCVLRGTVGACVMTDKRCSTCKEVKLITEFSRCKTNKDGLQYRCKACKVAHYRVNREAAQEYGAAYRAENREAIREYNATYRAENREARNEYSAAYRAENREAIREYNAAYRAENRDAILEQKAAYYAENREARRAYDAAWARANPDKRAANCHKRRATKKGASSDQWTRTQVYDEEMGVCHLCGTFVPWEDYHADHVIPLSKGGSNMRENIRVSHSTCNIRKGAKLN